MSMAHTKLSRTFKQFVLGHRMCKKQMQSKYKKMQARFHQYPVQVSLAAQEAVTERFLLKRCACLPSLLAHWLCRHALNLVDVLPNSSPVQRGIIICVLLSHIQLSARPLMCQCLDTDGSVDSAEEETSLRFLHATSELKHTRHAVHIFCRSRKDSSSTGVMLLKLTYCTRSIHLFAKHHSRYHAAPSGHANVQRLLVIVWKASTLCSDLQLMQIYLLQSIVTHVCCNSLFAVDRTHVDT